MLRLLLLSLAVYRLAAVPLPSASKSSGQKILHDERQEGDYNIRADLKNIIIFVMPGSSATPSPSLDLLGLLKSNRSKPPRRAGSDTKHFIEAKTAPYHVNIGKSDSHLLNDEILATQAPSVGIAAETPSKKTAALLRKLRSAKAFVLTVPEEDFVITQMEDDKDVVKKDGLKKQNKRKTDEMTLLGALEQCGPEMYRDAEGVCRLVDGRDE
ncbi:uncharacterized protein LOC143191698 [Rhynchophorus ferrugineus]|uniref:uncharacterized protein LOC143191698 n=1 Tax=Rhynchophorus ferrugineus TaxID=354439 RepID=UPI003FCDDA9C